MELPASLAQIQIIGTEQTPAERAFIADLTAALRQHGARITSTAGATVIRVRVTAPKPQAQTTDASGLARLYQIAYRVVFSVNPPHASGDAPSEKQTIALDRVYDYAVARRLSVEAEANFLRAEMRREAVARTIRRLHHL